jgi:hypothetical protein
VVSDNLRVRAPGPVLVYTSYRVALFFVTLVVLYAFGLRQLLLLVVAVLVSGLLSFVLLSRHRDAMSQSVVRRGQGIRDRMRESTESEDEYDDAMRAEAEQRERSGEGEADRDEDGER